MITTSPNGFGLFELDLMGKVMYSRVDPNNSSVNLPKDLTGLNFFDEVAPFENIEELRRRFRYFAKGSDSAQKFTFICQSGEQPLEVKVMLTQISEREFDGKEKLIIVDIRKAQ
jgi:hypothetical protein